jgi:mono/diheme cytochrome c family protein
LFALNNRQKFTGTVQAGWRAYNITPDHSSGVGAWSDIDLAHYLSMGHADGRGTASGPMGEAVDASLSYLTGGDIGAIVTYLRSVPSVVTADLPEPKSAPATAEQTASLESTHAPGKQVYEGACAGCHGWTGISPVIPFATLTGTRSINDPSAINVAQVIIGGGHRHRTYDAENMPAFGTTYSDAEIAGVANYVTARYGAKGSDLTAAQVAKLRAEE